MAEHQISMVVFDWAGTTVDYGSSAPHRVFGEVFSKHGIRLTDGEIDGPMGMEKKDHIRALLSLPSGSAQFEKVNGRKFTEADVEAWYEEFERTLHDIVAKYSTPLPGVLDTVSELRSMGLKIGSTTGYTSEMMKAVLPAAKALGYAPDCVVTPDVTGSGRPAPFMLFECMRQLNVYPPCRVIKVGDTVADMLEGKNAGAYAVGVLEGSNLLGLSEEQYARTPSSELCALKARARSRYLEAGADFVIDSISELFALVSALDARSSRQA